MIKRKDITFDKRANKYDEGFEGRLSERFYRNLWDTIILKNDDYILDVGCGTGTILKRLSQKADVYGFGIDVSESMIFEAKQKCPEMQFQIGDCGKLPFADNSMDIITTCMAYHHFPMQEVFRREAFRILKEGGKLYICDPRFPLIVRGVMNGIFKILNTNAHFYKPEAMKNDFLGDGFQFESLIEDAYVQVLVMKK